MHINLLLAAVGDAAPQNGAVQLSVLYGAISALTTALVFLFNRITRTEARLLKQLKDEAANCESEKVRMFEFSMKLVEYITALTKLTCSAIDCPMRKAIPPIPQATAADMGMRQRK